MNDVFPLIIVFLVFAAPCKLDVCHSEVFQPVWHHV